MTLLTPQEIEKIIKNKFPQAQVLIEDRGIAPGYPDLRRASIRMYLFGSLVQFNYGENIVLLLDGHVVDALKNIPLLTPKDVKDAVEFWLNDIQKYLSHHELPEVKHLARKYLGNEDKVERQTRALYVFYDVFFIVITPFAAFLFLKSTRKLVYFKRYNNDSELEAFFKLSVVYAEHIRQGKIT